MASYQFWLSDKDKHTLTLRTLECATEEVEERALMLLRGEGPVIHAAEVWDAEKRVCRVERGMDRTERSRDDAPGPISARDTGDRPDLSKPGPEPGKNRF